MLADAVAEELLVLGGGLEDGESLGQGQDDSLADVRVAGCGGDVAGQRVETPSA